MIVELSRGSVRSDGWKCYDFGPQSSEDGVVGRRAKSMIPTIVVLTTGSTILRTPGQLSLHLPRREDIPVMISGWRAGRVHMA